MNDPCLREDVAPLCPGCECHCCRTHSRAYVHHLLVANELLFEVLLYTHNQFQTVRLFDSARAAEAKWGGNALEAWAASYC